MNTSYALALTLSAIVAGMVAIVAWRRRTAAGASGLAVAMLGIVIWSLTYAIRWSVTDLTAQYFWLDATYLGVVTAPPAFLILALQFTQRTRLLTRRNLALLAVMPVLTLLLLWTDNLHGLFYAGMRTTGTILNGGAWFWINAIYLYGLLLVAAGVLVQAFVRAPQLYRRQAGTILLGILLPWAGNIVSLGKLSPFPDLDITPFVFLLSGLVFAIGLFRYRLLDIVPIAHDKLIEGMSDGLIVVDALARIVDINPAAHQIVGLSADSIGQPVASALATRFNLDEYLHTDTETQGEVRIASHPPRDYDVRVSPLYDPRRRLTGWLIILREITERKRAAEALQTAAQENARLYEEVRGYAVALEARVDERTAELAASNRSLAAAFERMQALERLKSQFLTNASHELRTPMTNIVSYLHLLQHGRPEKRDKYLDVLNRETAQMRGLLENLLEISSQDFGQGQLALTPLDLNALLAELAQSGLATVVERGLQLTIRPGPALPNVPGDAKLLRLALTNLIMDVADRTGAGGAITACTQAHSDAEGAWVVIAVGNGISTSSDADWQDWIAGTRPIGPAEAVGLRQVICREVLHRHGGKLCASTETTKDSFFVAWLPTPP